MKSNEIDHSNRDRSEGVESGERIGNPTYESTATSTLHECAFRNYKYMIRRRFASVLTSLPFPPPSPSPPHSVRKPSSARDRSRTFAAVRSGHCVNAMNCCIAER